MNMWRGISIVMLAYSARTIAGDDVGGVPTAAPALRNGSSRVAELCWSATTETTIDCASAVANDYCDSDPTTPLNGYLRDAFYTGSACEACTPTEETCGDALDNDCDGRVDCEDPDCLANGSCTLNQWERSCGTALAGIHYGSYETKCRDGLDNDGDGHIDCQDRDCIYGTACPELGDADCVCADLDDDGIIFEDWDDLALAAGTPDYDRVYRCAQIYNPFCTDAQTRTFLEWMRDTKYLGRIIAIHAEDANDPVKRTTGTNATFQFYYDLRNNDPFGSGNMPIAATAFKAEGVFEVEFIQVVATDADIVNDINTAEEVDQFLQPYFQDHVFGRETQFIYSQLPVNYETEFGPHFPCTSHPGFACFDNDAMWSWSFNLMFPKVAVLHWGGNALTDGTPIHYNRSCQTCYPNMEQLTRPLTVYAHEFCHVMALPHPLSTYPYDVTQNFLNALGTVGIVATLGYIYGGPERLPPLARYALEPNGGYLDDNTFGLTWSTEVLICPPVYIEVGACCPGTGEGCTVLDREGCEGGGGFFFGEGTECTLGSCSAVAEGCRYVQVTPPDTGSAVALLFTGDAGNPTVSCVVRYVQLDGTLGTDPVFQTSAEWGTVHVKGEEILPAASYNVQVDSGSPGNPVLSAPTGLTMWRWGDVDGNGQTGFLDALLVVEGFKDNFTNAALEAMDIHPCLPDGLPGFLDILNVVWGFQDRPYTVTGCSLPCE